MVKEFKILDFMTKRLGLSGNNLVLFGLMWAESKGGKDIVLGNYTKLSGAMGVTIPTLYNCLKNLKELGYISSPEKGIYQVVANPKLS